LEGEVLTYEMIENLGVDFHKRMVAVVKEILDATRAQRNELGMKYA
jgi:hypothetical protein